MHAANDFTEPTTDYWQALLASLPDDLAGPPFRFGLPVTLPDGRWLVLPIRRRPGEPDRAVASLVPNHASFAVVDALAGFMADLALPLQPDVVVGLPTLGLALAAPIALKLRHRNFVPLGYSRKFWYRDELSQPVASITSPDAGKRLHLDPNLVPRLRGRRAVIVDDTISSGQTALATLDLLARVDVEVVGLIHAMSQGSAWRGALADQWRQRVRFVFESPMLQRTESGWVPAA